MYLIDKNRVVHAASLQGSYEAYFIQNYFENKEAVEKAFGEDETIMMERDTVEDEVRYFDTNINFNEEVPAEADINKQDLIDASESEEEYKELVERLREYYLGTPVF